MNICLLNDSFPPVIDGVANVVLNYAKILHDTEYTNVMVGTPRYPDTDYSAYPYKVVPYQSVAGPASASGYRAGNPFDQGAANEMIAFGPDILHAHSPASALFMARVLRYATDAPIVYTYHTKYDIDIARAVKSEILQKETIKALVENVSACDEVWAVSRGAGENLRSLGYTGEYRVMTNGVDFPKGRSSEQEIAEAVKGFDLPDGIPMFLFVGRIMNYKGLPIILDALRKLSDSGVDFRMVFVGSGADAEELQKKALADGFAVDVRSEEEPEIRPLGTGAFRKGKIIFTGAVRDRAMLRAWNTRADLFLFPSTFDTNGLVVREAAACGLASVLIKDSCASEGITDGRNGFLIEENADSLAALLETLCREAETMRLAGDRAMEEIYVSWKDCVSEAHDRYALLLEKKAKNLLKGRKKDAADYFLQMAGEVTLTSYDAFHTRQLVYEGMMENAADIRETIQENLGLVKKTLGSIEEEMRSARKAAKESLGLLRNDVRSEFEEWKKY